MVTDTVAYDPYGTILARTGTTSTPFLFVGQYGVYTDSSGLNYMRARYYNPQIKCFINQDTLLGSIATVQSLNRCAYTKGNPINYIDPNGHDATTIALAIGGLATVLAGDLCAPEALVLIAGIGAGLSLVSLAYSTYQFVNGDIQLPEYITNVGFDTLGIFTGGADMWIGHIGEELAPDALKLTAAALDGTSYALAPSGIAIDGIQTGTHKIFQDGGSEGNQDENSSDIKHNS